MSEDNSKTPGHEHNGVSPIGVTIFHFLFHKVVPFLMYNSLNLSKQKFTNFILVIATISLFLRTKFRTRMTGQKLNLCH